MIYVLVGTLEVIALYLAFQIRKVKVKGLDDSKHTALFVCVNTMLLIAGIVAYLFFSFTIYNNTSQAVNGVSMWIIATTLLGFQFIPKVTATWSNFCT